MPIQGGELVAKNILAFGNKFRAEVDVDFERVRDLLDSRVKKNTGLTDHSLADLRRLGHPYARRAPQEIHSPGYQVHTQSGALQDARFSGTDKASVGSGKLSARAFVGFDPSKAPHAASVVYGTSKMVPRDPLVGSLGEVKERAFDLLSRSLRGAVINFNGERRKV